MAPPALQTDATRHTLSRQFFEQQSSPWVHASPCDLQVALGMGVHLPEVQMPEQHSEGSLQSPSIWTHAPPKHFPFTQCSEQQSPGLVHAASSARQTATPLQTVVPLPLSAQTPVQQLRLPPAVQLSPSWMQLGGGGGSEASGGSVDWQKPSVQ